ncbi:hypothetical protein BCR33DRAFT_529364 [Rhizoclosmatium globosum]|uniref:Uncharacterized protein n=1 Tax=Rhizoclosmatium globosum TaxID=329046 RepID=A0A1Y2CTR4_9FUNG|nr:hypothetical protein BCR33DRAFT_529364 [Rhizoclosmatium globosum]|eukprot:ORY50429.1 hypothetical protein BCR33DRAFT_529364 [Rhizoclosmatium globosum]
MAQRIHGLLTTRELILGIGEGLVGLVRGLRVGRGWQKGMKYHVFRRWQDCLRFGIGCKGRGVVLRRRGETGARSLSGSEVLLLNRYRNERGEEHEDGLETRLARNENRVGGQSSSPRRFMLDSLLNDSTHTERVVARITNIRAMIRPTTPSVALPPMTRTTNTGRRSTIQTQPQLQTHIEIHPQPQSDVDDEMPSLLTRSSTANSEISTSQTTPFDPVALFERYLNQHIDNEKQPTPTNTQSSGLRKNSCHPTNLPTLTLRSLQQLRALGSLNNTRVSLTIPRERHQRIMYLNGKSHTFIDEMPDLKLLEIENDQLKWQVGEQGHAIRCSGTGLVKLLDVNGCPVAPASWEHVDLVMKVLCSGGSSSTGFEGGARRSSEAGSGAERGVRSREREVEGRSQRRRLQRREGGEWALIEETN